LKLETRNKKIWFVVSSDLDRGDCDWREVHFVSSIRFLDGSLTIYDILTIYVM